jgi:hypothetical protein
MGIPGAMLMHEAVFFGGNPRQTKTGPYTFILEVGKEPIGWEEWMGNARDYGRNPHCRFYVCPIGIPQQVQGFRVREWPYRVIGVLVADNCQRPMDRSPTRASKPS